MYLTLPHTSLLTYNLLNQTDHAVLFYRAFLHRKLSIVSNGRVQRLLLFNSHMHTLYSYIHCTVFFCFCTFFFLLHITHCALFTFPPSHFLFSRPYYSFQCILPPLATTLPETRFSFQHRNLRDSMPILE